MTDPIHFAARITTAPPQLVDGEMVQTSAVYIALCGYAGFNALMFTDVHGKVRKSLGGCVTCEKCLEKIGVKPT